MIEIVHRPANNPVTIRASGKLSIKDCDEALPELEQAIALSEDSLNAVLIVDRLKRRDLGALWKDLKFDRRHYHDFNRIAIVGNSEVKKWGPEFSSLATSAAVEYFTVDQLVDDRAWVTAS